MLKKHHQKSSNEGSANVYSPKLENRAKGGPDSLPQQQGIEGKVVRLSLNLEELLGLFLDSSSQVFPCEDFPSEDFPR